MELSQAFRCTASASLRQLGVFNEAYPSMPGTAPVEQRWKSFVDHEERRRLGMAAFRASFFRPFSLDRYEYELTGIVSSS